MERILASMSKSSPNIFTDKSDKDIKKEKSEKNHRKKHRYQDIKRNIVVNPEKGAAAQRKPYLIFEKEHNFTPRPLYDSAFPSASDKMFAGLPAAKPLSLKRRGTISKGTMTQEDRSVASMHSFVSIAQSRFSFTKRSKSSMTTSLFGTDLAFIEEDATMLLSLGMDSDLEEEIGLLPDDRPPSMFRLRKDPPPRNRKIETVFTVTLQESDTIFLLQIPSVADFSESEPGKAISDYNALYEKQKLMTKTKSYTATQTNRVFSKHQKLFFPRNHRCNAGTFASIWDIYDTYEKELRISEASIEIEEGQVGQIKLSGDEEMYSEKFEYLGHKFSSNLLNALMLMERMIQKNIYGEQQLLFQGLLVQDPLSLDIKCNYSLQHLWTFHSRSTKKRRVTSISWSSKIHNVLAVGYGKYNFTDQSGGLVCIWNVKNPSVPERSFEFVEPVTFVTFSPVRTQILAVSFYNGHLILIDIISRSIVTKASNHSYPLYYPVWQVRWFPNDSGTPGQILVTCGKNGRIYRYKKTKFFVSKKIMSVKRPQGNIQGVDQPKKCFARKTLSSLHPSAEVLIRHPTDPLLYLIGTSEGYVYVCSVNHRRDHIEVFTAHNGPVYTIQFNPFSPKIFLTCGADWCIRIWVEGIYEPIITLESGMAAVQDALWNPLHSTIIVSITGTFIEVWDIRRKTSTPKSSTRSPSKSVNTVLRFTRNKYNVCVGDTDGNVHILALTEMPFSPSFQEDVLVQSILNALISRPDMIEKLRRLGKPFAYEESSYKSQMYRKLNHLQKIM